MEIEPLINQFGYLAIFLGTMIEGEAVLLLGGFFAQQGFLNLPTVILFGFIGTYCSEAALYHLGLSKGPGLLRGSPRRLAYYERFAIRLHRHKYLLILGYRFFYGMRSIAPLAIGASGIQPALFHSLNFIGTVIWTLVVASLGFFFGRTINGYLEHTNGYGVWIPVGVMMLVLVIRWLTYSRKSTSEMMDGTDQNLQTGDPMNDESLSSTNTAGRETNRLAFFAGFLRNPQEVGSVIPSSRFLEQRIMSAADLSSVRLVVELGPGTGGTTRAILGRLPKEAKLLTIDMNPDFIDLLNRIPDPRLINHLGSATNLGQILNDRNLGSADVVISGIPFSTMPAQVGHNVVSAVREALTGGGRFVAYQFRDEVANITRPIMGEPDSVLEWRNVPPMRVYRWNKRAGQSTVIDKSREFEEPVSHAALADSRQ